MTDLICSFSYSRSLTTNYTLPLFLPLRRCYSSALHIHNSRITGIKRSSSHPLLFFKPSPFAASASEIDVISTHKHSDGSFVFRFGDPSEIQKNAETEEPKTVEEEIEGEDKKGSSVPKLKEGDDEAKVIPSGLTEVSDHADSIDSSSNVVTVEGENEFSEQLLEDDTVLPVLTSNKEMGGISTSALDIEHIENVEHIDEEYKDMSLIGLTDESSKIENSIATLEVSSDELLEETSDVTTTSKETELTSITGVDVGQLSVNVEECLDLEYSPTDASLLDQSSDMVDNVTTVALSAKDSDDISSSDVDIDESGKVEEGQNDDHEDSPVDSFVLDESSEVVNGASTVSLLEKETDDITSTSNIEIEPSGDVEEGINEEYEDSQVEKYLLDNRSEVLNVINTEKQTADIISIDIEEESTGNVEASKNEVYEDSPELDASSQVLNNFTSEISSEKKTHDIASTSEIEIEPTGNLEEGINEEYEDFLVDASKQDKSSEVLNIITTEASMEKETDCISVTSDIVEITGNVEEGINEGCEDSPGDKSVLGKSSKVLNFITREESSDIETADINSAPDIDIDYTGNVEQGLDVVLEEPSSVNASRPNKSSMVENDITAQDILGKETADETILVDFNTKPVVDVLDTDSYQGSLETTYSTNEAPSSDHNEETVTQDETIGDDEVSFDNNFVSPSPQLESAVSLNEELQTLAIEENSETDVDNVKAFEMQNVLSYKNGSDIGAEDEPPTMELATTPSIGSEEQASGSGSGIPNETFGCATEKDTVQLFTVPPELEVDSILQEETDTETVEEPMDDDASENQTVNGDLVEASVVEVIVPESTESIITSQELLINDFVLSSGAALLPHPSKVLTGGEDAYFIAGQTWLGLADGVSQWSLEGTIEGVYAQELIKNCEKLVSDCSDNSINNPIELLNLSVAQTNSPGCSTVLIGQFDGQALHVANIGDSGFIVLRHGAVYKKSSPMHHAFSLPVHIERGDDPSCIAQLYRVDLEEEDIIVLATDGLLDNLYDQEISLIAMKSLANHKSPEEIATALAKRAQEVGRSAYARSPFADDAQAAGFPGYSGGKLDEVAVIVSIVQRLQ